MCFANTPVRFEPREAIPQWSHPENSLPQKLTPSDTHLGRMPRQCGVVFVRVSSPRWRSFRTIRQRRLRSLLSGPCTNIDQWSCHDVTVVVGCKQQTRPPRKPTDENPQTSTSTGRTGGFGKRTRFSVDTCDMPRTRCSRPRRAKGSRYVRPPAKRCTAFMSSRNVVWVPDPAARQNRWAPALSPFASCGRTVPLAPFGTHGRCRRHPATCGRRSGATAARCYLTPLFTRLPRLDSVLSSEIKFPIST